MKIEKQAIKKYKQFFGRPADKAGRVEIPRPKTLVLLGEAVSIEYRAAKKNDPRTGGKLATYKHKLGAGVRVFTDPKGKALFIVGGKFRVTDWMRD